MSTSPRNVLLITVDQWSASALGCEGHPAILTPTLDSLAAAGTRYSNAYSECPVCIPARRTWHTGQHPREHGVLINRAVPLGETPTLAQSFRDQGYQACAVGKMHVHPARDRAGFDDTILDEEGRIGPGLDDYELHLGDQGLPGQRFAGGMCNNDYLWRPWHLAEELHPTTWTARQMARVIRRRDPTKPSFWYCSFSCPHPPLTPLSDYLALYDDSDIPLPVAGEWADAPEIDEREAARLRSLRRAYYAVCTHIDHQIRVVIGTLREAGLLNDTVICFTADHGEELGTHGRWGKCWYSEASTRVPFLLLGAVDDERIGVDVVDDRLVGGEDLMPTLLAAAGLDVPEHCTGQPAFGDQRREQLYGCFGAPDQRPIDRPIQRMLRHAQHKLIWQPVGNHWQLIDLSEDPHELHNRADDAALADVRADLTARLLSELPASEQTAWLQHGQPVGEAPPEGKAAKPLWTTRHLNGQRGFQWPSR